MENTKMQIVLTPYAFECNHLVREETPDEQAEDSATAVVTPYLIADSGHEDGGQRVRWSCSLGNVCRSLLCRFSRHDEPRGPRAS